MPPKVAEKTDKPEMAANRNARKKAKAKKKAKEAEMMAMARKTDKAISRNRRRKTAKTEMLKCLATTSAVRLLSTSVKP